MTLQHKKDTAKDTNAQNFIFFSLQVSKHQKVAMPYKAGREENGFLSTLNLTIEDLEPLANKATRVRNTRQVSSDPQSRQNYFFFKFSYRYWFGIPELRREISQSMVI